MIFSLRAGSTISLHPNQLILIVLDAARADHFSTYGYSRRTTPNIDMLAAEGVVFLNHFSQGTETRAATPGLLYSRYFFKPLFPYSPNVPLTHPEELFRIPDRESISLPKAVSMSGLRTCMITAHLWMQPRTALAQDFDEVYNLSSLTDVMVPEGSAVVNHAMKWIEDHKSESYFLYLHLMDTHFPHRLEHFSRSYLKAEGLPPVRPSRFDENGIPERISQPLTDFERKYLDAIYDGSLRKADVQLGRLFSYLQSNESFQRTTVAITADHGELLLETPDRFMHGTDWYDPVARVPFIVSSPGRLEPARIGSISESVDVMPTLLALMGIDPIPGKLMDGMNLLPALKGFNPFREIALSEKGITDGRYKCLFDTPTDQIMNTEGIENLKGRLFDLQADPMETRDVWAVKPDVVNRMAKEYKRKLQYSYQRYETASTSTMPDSAFAIGANSFNVRTPTGYPFWKEAGWERDETWNNFHFLGHPNAAPLEIEFPIPNGTYQVEFRGYGEASARAGDSADFIDIGSRSIRTLTEMRMHPGETIPFKSVEIHNSVFRIEILCNDQPFLIRYIGFRPDTPHSQEAIEMNATHLKALGYIH